MSALPPLPVAVPLAAAAVVLFAHWIVPPWVVRTVTLMASLAEVVIALVLVHRAGAGTIVYWFGGWAPRGGVALGVSFTIDQLGAGAAALAGIVTLAAVLVAPFDPDAEPDGILDALMLTLLAAMAGFSLTGDLFNMFVFFELMAVSAFAVAAYHTRSPAALRSALNFAVTNSIGAFMVLMGLALLYSRTGALNMAQIGRQLQRSGSPDRLVVLALSLLVVGFLVKAAVIPFHFWLVGTVSSAPLSLVVVLAGLLDTLGVYAVARIYWTIFHGVHPPALGPILVLLGAFSAVAAGGCSVVVHNPRRRLAFVMVAHTGVVLIGVGCLSGSGIAGAAVYSIADGTAKAAAVLGLSVAARRWRLGSAILATSGLVLAGLPVFGVGLGKAVIERAADAAGYPWITPIIVAAAVLTGAAVLDLALSPPPGDPGTHRDESLPVGAVAVAFLGIAAAATLAGRWTSSAAARFVSTAAYQSRVLGGGRINLRAGQPRVALSGGGVMLDLIAVAGAIGLGVLLARRREAQQPSPVRRLILQLDSGSVGDSATWLTVGAATVGLVLATSLR